MISKRRWIWPVLVAALIFFASSRSYMPGPQVEGSDKLGHFLIYGLLGTLIVRVGRGGGKTALIAVAIASAYGVTDEFHQSFVPGRSVELADWVADTCGAALAVGLYSGWPAYRRMLETAVWRRDRAGKVRAVGAVSSP